MAEDCENLIVMLALLRHARNTYGRAMRAALAEAGCEDMPRNGMYVIGGLAMEDERVSLSQLIRELGVSKQSAGQLVDMLVMRGYLERFPDADDRRRLVVQLTERGKLAAGAQALARAALDDELERRVGADAVRQTRITLAALIDMGDALHVEPLE